MLFKCTMAFFFFFYNAICQQAAHMMWSYHRPSSPSCQTRAIQKSQTFNRKYLRMFWETNLKEWTMSKKQNKK